MNRLIIALVCGALFGAGLVISDMINPGRVLAFLDVAGAWDPALALVMGGALIPSTIAYRLRQRRTAPVLAERFSIPAGNPVDAAIIGGAILFGLGWGLIGLCPGPALAALVTGSSEALIFVAAMLSGMVLHRLTLGRAKAKSSA